MKHGAIPASVFLMEIVFKADFTRMLGIASQALMPESVRCDICLAMLDRMPIAGVVLSGVFRG